MSAAPPKQGKLVELLTDDQVESVTKILAQRDNDKLRAYLRGIEKQLQEKGIVADYLYYYLVWKFGL